MDGVVSYVYIQKWNICYVCWKIEQHMTALKVKKNQLSMGNSCKGTINQEET